MKPNIYNVRIGEKNVYFYSVPKNGGSTTRAYMTIAAGIKTEDSYFNLLEKLWSKKTESEKIRAEYKF